MLLFHGGKNPRLTGGSSLHNIPRLAWWYSEHHYLWVGWFVLPPKPHIRRLDAGGLMLYGGDRFCGTGTDGPFFEQPGRWSMHSITYEGETTVVQNVRDPHILSTVVATTEPWRYRVLAKFPGRPAVQDRQSA